jgi:aminomethyltransferase
MGLHTPLYNAHLEAGAKMVDFGGWDMPIHYGSQMAEHEAVRENAGLFDVSHMTDVEITGDGARAFLSALLANDINKLQTAGKALYSCMLNETGGVVDDLITYFINEQHFRMVVNAATHDKDLAWLNQHAESYDVQVIERTDLAMLAVQGPNAREKVISLLDDATDVLALKPFSAAGYKDWFIARTGYTGEDGFEIMLPAGQATSFWNQLLASGVVPCGLGARDTLRLEAGMNLYGQDMDETTSPLESGLGWTVAMKDERDFIGRTALEKQKADGLYFKLVGLVLEDRGVLRPGQNIVGADGEEGVTTSGSYSPSLKRAIALARVPRTVKERCFVEIRGKLLEARVVQPPFVRNGRACDGIMS